MYSVVLMAMLAAGGDAPNCGHKTGCGHGCGGYYGYAGCCGYGYGYGADCCDGGYGALGWYSGGWGSCYGGCWGGCYGCHGCYGCYGYYGCNTNGCYNGLGFTPGVPTLVDPHGSAPFIPPMPEGSGAPKGSPSQTGATSGGKAKLVLEVPQGAKIYVDGTLTRSTATQRVFSTPHLEVGQSYYYDFRIEVERDGKTFTENKRVIVKAGEDYKESFADLGKRPADTAVADAKK
jgi:uncharacterized protein (TIGR03000 family)